jgi:hypothetical protein
MNVLNRLPFASFLDVSILLACLLLASCAARIQAVSLNDRQYAPSDFVEVVAGPVDYKYEVLGTIYGAQRNVWMSLDEVRRAMVEKAKQMGATALINFGTQQQAQGATGVVFTGNPYVAHGAMNMRYQVVLSGTAIRRIPNPGVSPCGSPQ